MPFKLKSLTTIEEARHATASLEDGIYLQVIEGFEKNQQCNSVYLWVFKNRYFHELSFNGKIINPCFMDPSEFLLSHEGMLVDDDNRLIRHEMKYRVGYFIGADYHECNTVYASLKEANAMKKMLRLMKSEITVDVSSVLEHLKVMQQR